MRCAPWRNTAVAGAFFDEVKLAGGVERHLDAAVARLESQYGDFDTIQQDRRRDGRDPAGLTAGRYGQPAVADAHMISRLGSDHGDVFDTLSTAAIIDRAIPKVSRG